MEAPTGRALAPDEGDEPDAPQERWVTVGRGPLHCRLWSAASGAADRPPLVFLHEGLGSIGLWRSFPDDVRVDVGRPTTLSYSRHGYGHSAVVPEPREVDYMHREALEVLPALLQLLEIERPVLVGHSDGASIAAIHAGAGHPVAGLVLLAPHVVVEQCTVDAIDAVRTTFATTDLAARLARHHDDAGATFRGWNDVWLSPAFRSWNIESYLPSITAPVLVVQGAGDEYGTLAQVDAIESGVAGPFQRLVVPGGHSPHLAASEMTRAAVVDAVRRWCRAG